MRTALIAWMMFIGSPVLAQEVPPWFSESLLHLPDDERSVLPWAIAAFVLYLLVFVITVGVNVPMNDRIKAAGDPDEIDVHAVRAEFDERKWVRFNHLRAVASLAAFGCLAWALVEHGGP